MQYPMNTQSIYLDHAAATPLSQAAGAAMLAQLYEPYANPSSLHHLGRAAHDSLKHSRESLASSLAVTADELILTGSGTESDNLALLGLARAHQAHGNHVIVSSIEHKAILAAAAQLETEGFRVTYLGVDSDGVVSLDELKDALCSETILVSVMHANNEIGTIQPIPDIVRICRNHPERTNPYPLVHTDACQVIGLRDSSPRKLGVDALTINSAKIYGPKGIGLLFVRQGVGVQPVILGGDQERGLRAGTENSMLAAGFAAALHEAVEQTTAQAAAMCALQEHFIAELKAAVPRIRFNGHPTQRLPNNVHTTIPDIEGESLVLMLSEYGICAATGSACSSLDLEPSHVLSAIGQDENLIHGSLRFSFGRSTTKEDLSFTAKTLGEVTKRLRAITACTTVAYAHRKHTV